MNSPGSGGEAGPSRTPDRRSQNEQTANDNSTPPTSPGGIGSGSGQWNTPRSTRGSSRVSSVRVRSSESGTPSRRRLISGSNVSKRDAMINGNGTPRRSESVAASPFRGTSEFDLSSPLNYGTPSSVGSTRSGIRGAGATPVRLRPDVRQNTRSRYIDPIRENREDEADEAAIRSSETNGAADGSGVSVHIWGTNVDVELCRRKFRRFLENFVGDMPDEDEISDYIDPTLNFYLRKLEEIKILEHPFLNLNCAHLEEFDIELYRQLVMYPQDVIPVLDVAATKLFEDRYGAASADIPHQIQVRPFNSRVKKNMRSLDPEDIEQLITVRGMVIRTSNATPEIRVAFFRCTECSFETQVPVERAYINEPTLCSSCSTSRCFQLIHNRCEYMDKQMIKLQESNDDVPAGQTPHAVTLVCFNDLVDSVKPGERVTVTGIFRAVPMQVNPRMSVVHSVFRTFIDVIHFQRMDQNRLHEIEEGKTHKFSDEKINLIRHLSTTDDIYERLARAIAPSIYENEDVKKGILLQLFGGTKQDQSNSGRGHIRSEMHILLCGDPGTSKSQLLSYIYNLVPRSQYTSGKGSSAVGLTAYIVKDPETRQYILQNGALVLADNGICCIDEFDKMNDSTRSILHEVMEQQTLSIAKAGMICQLNAKTSIIAAANPCESQWNPKKTIVENIELPHSLLSRFDLIFLLLDPQNDIYDRKLATHLVSLYYAREDVDENMMEMEVLRDYITYAKENINPEMSPEAKRLLAETYVKMRGVGSGRGQITAYPRQLESLIRLSEAHAKMKLSNTVYESDVQEAARLYREALKQSATDPVTGRIDIDIIITGRSNTRKKEEEEVCAELIKLLKLKDKSSTLDRQKLWKELNNLMKKTVDLEIFSDSLRELQNQGVIVLSKTTVRVV